MGNTATPAGTGLPSDVPPLARMLTYAGMLPFLAGLLVSLSMAPPGIAPGTILVAVKAYAAVILAFLGGVHWGLALTASHPARFEAGLVISVIPPLVGALALLAPAPWVFAVFAMAFLVQGLLDSLMLRTLRPGGWYGRLRLEATAVVVIVLALCALFAEGG